MHRGGHERAELDLSASDTCRSLLVPDCVAVGRPSRRRVKADSISANRPLRADFTPALYLPCERRAGRSSGRLLLFFILDFFFLS